MKFKKFLSLVLAVSMIATCVFAGTVSAAEETVLFHETFDADLNGAYWSVNGAAVSDGAMKVANGNWPVLWLTYLGITYDPLKSYEFSYRVKFTSDAGSNGCSWKCYDYNNRGTIYGGAAVGKGFGFETADPNYSVKEGFEANTGKWYTVKTEMRTDAATRYIKRTLLDEDGSEIASYSDTNIYKSPDDVQEKVAQGDNEQIINQICFWNCGLTDDVFVDDIIIKEVEPSVVPVENNLIFEETFANDTFDNASSWTQHTAVVDNGTLKVPGNSWPVMTMPTPSKKDAAYKFSYRIKTDSDTSGTLVGDLFRVLSTDYKRAFGSYKPGSGAIFRNSLWSTEVASAPWELFKKDEWYTFETTFCEKSGSQYTKWSIKNADGDEIYADGVNYLPDALNPGTADDSGSVFGKGMYFWNADTTGNVTFWIDDIKLEKVQIEEIEEEISFVDEKFDAADLSGLNGWRGANGDVSIDSGTLKLSEGSYIYFDVPGKNGNDTYKITYDVMVEGETGSANNSIALLGNDIYFLGNFNPLTGLGNTFGFAEPNEIIPVTNGNGKWYTVSVEFCESKDNGFMRYSLTDRETGALIGTYLCPYLKSSEGAADVSGINATSYYFWNRGAAGTVAYIDNLKFIRTSNAMYLDKVTATDYAGNVLSLDDGISPAVENIKVGFTAKVTDASAKGGISLKEKASNTDVDFAFSSEGKNAVLTFAAPLKGNTEYQLIVSKDVKSANGTALAGESTVDFVTGAADTLGRIKPLGVSDIASLTPGGTLNVEASIANAENESRDAVIIAAFYSNGVLCSVQNGSTEEVNAASVKDIAFTVNVPKDMKDVTCVKIFLWSGFDGMKPYCAFAELNAPTEQ